MKKLRALILLLPILTSVSSFGQEALEETYKEIFLDAEYFFYQEEYLDALTIYNRIYKRGYEDNANINYKMGICYLNIPGQKDKSIDHLEKAIKKASNSYKEGVFKQDLAPLDAYAFLGNAYRINNRLDKAIETYNKYKSLIGDKKTDEKKYADQQIQDCLNAKELQKIPSEVIFANMGNIINSSSSNYNPAISGDGKSLVYMFELPFYDAVYYSVKENDTWGRPRNITPEIKSDGDLIVHNLSYDGKTLLMTKEDAFNSDIWMSELNDQGKWETAKPLSKVINTKYWESHASLSNDGKKLYFTSNRKDGIGGMDIYVSEKNALNLWEEAYNIGENINTELNEDCPIETPDGQYLFFTSQGHKCIGGYDIFYCRLKDDGSWSKPINIGYPLNTTDDEIFYYPSELLSGYVARLGDDSYGKEDIYKVSITPNLEIQKQLAEISQGKKAEPIEEVTEQKIIEPEEETAEEIIEETVAEKEPVEKTIEKPVEKVVEEVVEEQKEVIKEEKVAEKEVVEPEKEEIEEPVKVKIIEIKPVLFEFNSVSLTDKEKESLDKIILLMKETPTAKIKLNGYTDSKGTEQINIIISQRRAEAVREYLMRNEIGNSRIQAIGNGETDFIAINNKPDGSDSPEGRKYNRRVEIELTGLGEGIEIKQVLNIPENLKYKNQ